MKLLENKVAIRRINMEDVSPLILRRYEDKETQRGRVIAVGPGKTLPNGKVRPMEIQEGDTVLIPGAIGEVVWWEGEKLVVCTEDEISGVFTE